MNPDYRCRWCHRPLPVKEGLYWLDDRGRYECPGRFASAHKPRIRDLAAEQEREALRLEALDLHERFVKGDIDPSDYERLLADLGKPDDDLTRVGA